MIIENKPNKPLVDLKWVSELSSRRARFKTPIRGFENFFLYWNVQLIYAGPDGWFIRFTKGADGPWSTPWGFKTFEEAEECVQYLLPLDAIPVDAIPVDDN